MAFYKGKKGIFIIILLVIFFAFTGDYFYFKNRVYPGVFIKNVDLGYKAKDGIKTLLNNFPVSFSVPGDKTVFVSLEELGIYPDYEEIFALACREGRRREGILALFTRYKTIKGVAIPFKYRLDEEKLARSIDLLAQKFNSDPVDAFFRVINHDSLLVPERKGIRVNKKALADRLLENLENKDRPFIVSVPFQSLPAKITRSYLEERGVVSLMSSFSTRFDPGNVNRSHNIKLAAELLNNYFLAPGNYLSLNDFFGETTREKGYREAPVIIGGELVPGVGGGLCQISSTLYNAALLANLDIVARRNHQLTVPYIDPGRDATLAYPGVDLKIFNNKSHHLLINALVEGDTLTFNIFGSPFEEKVEISTVILETYQPPEKYIVDRDLPPGTEEKKEGSPGYLVEVWKTVYRGQNIISKERISLDSYQPYPTVIRHNPDNPR